MASIFSMSKSMCSYKRVVLLSADVARGATCRHVSHQTLDGVRARARGRPIPRATARLPSVAPGSLPTAAAFRNAKITSGTVFGVCVNNHLGTPRLDQ